MPQQTKHYKKRVSGVRILVLGELRKDAIRMKITILQLQHSEDIFSSKHIQYE
jgi:hypothetical protein